MDLVNCHKVVTTVPTVVRNYLHIARTEDLLELPIPSNLDYIDDLYIRIEAKDDGWSVPCVTPIYDNTTSISIHLRKNGTKKMLSSKHLFNLKRYDFKTSSFYHCIISSKHDLLKMINFNLSESNDKYQNYKIVIQLTARYTAWVSYIESITVFYNIYSRVINASISHSKNNNTFHGIPRVIRQSLLSYIDGSYVSMKGSDYREYHEWNVLNKDIDKNALLPNEFGNDNWSEILPCIGGQYFINNMFSGKYYLRNDMNIHYYHMNTDIELSNFLDSMAKMQKYKGVSKERMFEVCDSINPALLQGYDDGDNQTGIQSICQPEFIKSKIEEALTLQIYKTLASSCCDGEVQVQYDNDDCIVYACVSKYQEEEISNYCFESRQRSYLQFEIPENMECKDLYIRLLCHDDGGNSMLDLMSKKNLIHDTSDDDLDDYKKESFANSAKMRIAIENEKGEQVYTKTICHLIENEAGYHEYHVIIGKNDRICQLLNKGCKYKMSIITHSPYGCSAFCSFASIEMNHFQFGLKDLLDGNEYNESNSSSIMDCIVQYLEGSFVSKHDQFSVPFCKENDAYEHPWFLMIKLIDEMEYVDLQNGEYVALHSLQNKLRRNEKSYLNNDRRGLFMNQFLKVWKEIYKTTNIECSHLRPKQVFEDCEMKGVRWENWSFFIREKIIDHLKMCHSYSFLTFDVAQYIDDDVNKEKKKSINVIKQNEQTQKLNQDDDCLIM